MSSFADIIKYCPTCGRWLVVIHSDGKFDLAPKASTSIKFAIPNEIKPGYTAIGIPEPEKAECHRLICRFKRWLNRKGGI
jgi:hypothetical protein